MTVIGQAAISSTRALSGDQGRGRLAGLPDLLPPVHRGLLALRPRPLLRRRPSGRGAHLPLLQAPHRHLQEGVHVSL